MSTKQVTKLSFMELLLTSVLFKKYISFNLLLNLTSYFATDRMRSSVFNQRKGNTKNEHPTVVLFRVCEVPGCKTIRLSVSLH